MRVILAGSKSFGLAAYKMLLEQKHDIIGVWSPDNPEQPDGRLTAQAMSDKRWWHPITRDPETVASWGIDLFVCAHSHDFIGRLSRQATRLGGVGYHPSLLPRHRGRDAIEWTIRMGDPIAGGSVYWLTDQVDGGPIAAQDWCHVRPSDDASALWRRELFPMGIDQLQRTLQDIQNGYIREIPQDEVCATWEPALDGAPLYRPELLQIGRGIEGYTYINNRDEDATGGRWEGVT